MSYVFDEKDLEVFRAEANTLFEQRWDDYYERALRRAKSEGSAEIMKFSRKKRREGFIEGYLEGARDILTLWKRDQRGDEVESQDAEG